MRADGHDRSYVPSRLTESGVSRRQRAVPVARSHDPTQAVFERIDRHDDFPAKEERRSCISSRLTESGVSRRQRAVVVDRSHDPSRDVFERMDRRDYFSARDEKRSCVASRLTESGVSRRQRALVVDRSHDPSRDILKRTVLLPDGHYDFSVADLPSRIEAPTRSSHVPPRLNECAIASIPEGDSPDEPDLTRGPSSSLDPTRSEAFQRLRSTSQRVRVITRAAPPSPCHHLDAITGRVVAHLQQFHPTCEPPKADVISRGTRCVAAEDLRQVQEQAEREDLAARQAAYLGQPAGQEWVHLERQANTPYGVLPEGYNHHIFEFIDDISSHVEQVNVWSTGDVVLLHTVPPASLDWLFLDVMKGAATAQEEAHRSFLDSNPKFCVSPVRLNNPDLHLYEIDTRYALAFGVNPRGILVTIGYDGLTPIGRRRTEFQLPLCKMREKGVTDEQTDQYLERMKKVRDYVELIAAITSLQTRVRFYFNNKIEAMKEKKVYLSEIAVFETKEQRRMDTYLAKPLQIDGYQCFLEYVADFVELYKTTPDSQDMVGALVALQSVMEECNNTGRVIDDHAQALLLYEADRDGMQEHFVDSPRTVVRRRLPPRILSPTELVAIEANLPGNTPAERTLQHTEVDVRSSALTLAGLFVPARCCARTSTGHLRFRANLPTAEQNGLKRLIRRAQALELRVLTAHPSILPPAEPAVASAAL
jgi:hypothetical protein